MSDALDLSTPEAIDKLLALCDAATPDDEKKIREVKSLRASRLAVLNTDFVDALLRDYERASAARTALPLVLAELKAARERIRELEAPGDENDLVLRSDYEHVVQERDDFARHCIAIARGGTTEQECVRILAAAKGERSAGEKGREK